MELSAIFSVDPNLIQQEELNIAFLGSGPLPLTNLCLCNGVKVHRRGRRTRVLNVDCNLEAITQSRVLCAKLGKKAEGMCFLHAEAGSSDLQKFDVVYLAALVGHTLEEKERILLDVVKNMKVGGLLVIRSAERLRKVLYPVCLNISTMGEPQLEKVLRQNRILTRQLKRYWNAWKFVSQFIHTTMWLTRLSLAGSSLKIE
jgi:nicotianamine synthase